MNQNSIDSKLQQNSVNLTNIEYFLNSKQRQLSQLQNFLLQEFKNMESWKDQRNCLLQLINTKVKGVVRLCREFCLYFQKQYEMIVQQSFADFKGELNNFIIFYEKYYLKYNSENIRLEQLVNQERKKNQLLKKQIQQKSIQLNQQKQGNFYQQAVNHKRSMYFEEVEQKYLKSSKLLTKSSALLTQNNNKNQQSKKKSPLTKQIMKQVQKNLREGYNIAQKKNVKEKIQLLKMKNSGILLNMMHR